MGLLALLGIDVSETFNEGQSVGAGFLSGFKKGFDTEQITEALKEWASNNKEVVAVLGVVLGGKLIGGIYKGVKEAKSLVTDIKNIFGKGSGNTAPGASPSAYTTTTMTVWQVNDIYANSSSRRHGGAGRSVQLTKLKIQKRRPYFLRTNATIYFVKLKKEKLYILPDVIIVEGKKGLGTAALKDLDISVEDTRFVANTAPKDSTILSYTWQYVNNNGTPDKRFKNNVQLPVCQFGLVDLKTSGGFHTRLYLSSIQKTKQFSDIATEMIQHGNTLRQEEQQSEN